MWNDGGVEPVFIARRRRSLLALIWAILASALAAPALAMSIEEVVSGVVHIKTFINPDARTAAILGREREGSGIVIDDNGLVLTIGYLMVEAHAAEVATNAGSTLPAEVVGYDHETGFGLLRTIAPLKVRPMAFGRSTETAAGDPVLVASFGGPEMVGSARVAAKRPFAGNWEYLLDEAIFTVPPHPRWSGAALINRQGKLIGVGSLVVGDATGKGESGPGNMFVPIDRLAPILAELVAAGRAAKPARPWLGLNTEEVGGRLLVSRVTPDGPAAKAGVQRGDIILGVAGAAAIDLADFYRKVWAVGDAGVVVALDVLQDSEKRRIDVTSIDRLAHLKLRSTF